MNFTISVNNTVNISTELIFQNWLKPLFAAKLVTFPKNQRNHHLISDKFEIPEAMISIAKCSRANWFPSAKIQKYLYIFSYPLLILHNVIKINDTKRIIYFRDNSKIASDIFFCSATKKKHDDVGIQFSQTTKLMEHAAIAGTPTGISNNKSTTIFVYTCIKLTILNTIRMAAVQLLSMFGNIWATTGN